MQALHISFTIYIHLSFQGMIVEIAMIWEIGEWHDEWLRYRMIDDELVLGSIRACEHQVHRLG